MVRSPPSPEPTPSPPGHQGPPVLVRASPANAARVYRALASFGAPLSSFAVAEADFASYDGVLEVGLPPRRIDILNRADGITFDEAVAGHASQDLADVAALEAIARRPPG